MNVITGKRPKPLKCVLYAPEGIGKSTLASKFPNPLFLDTEDSTIHMDVARVELTNWKECEDSLEELCGGHDFGTIVIDTGDWMEQYLLADMLHKDGQQSIASYGYGEGYAKLNTRFQSDIIDRLNTLHAKGAHVVVICHAHIRKFESPTEDGDYDRYELKLEKKTAPKLKEWCDLLLFGNWKNQVIKSKDGSAKAVKGEASKKRTLYTERTAAFDAKNRFDLPAQIEFPGKEDPLPEELLAILKAAEKPKAPTKKAPAKKAPAKKAAAQKTESNGSNGNGDWQVDFDLLATDLGHEQINAFLIDRNQISEGQTWKDLEEGYARRCLELHDDFSAAVQDFAFEAA